MAGRGVRAAQGAGPPPLPRPRPASQAAARASQGRSGARRRGRAQCACSRRLGGGARDPPAARICGEAVSQVSVRPPAPPRLGEQALVESRPARVGVLPREGACLPLGGAERPVREPRGGYGDAVWRQAGPGESRVSLLSARTPAGRAAALHPPACPLVSLRGWAPRPRSGR